MVPRLGPAVAGLVVALSVTACGSGPVGTKSGDGSSASEPSSTSASGKNSDKAVGPAPTDREVHDLTGFVSPTGNVSCIIDADLARCDIMDRIWSPPPRPADCEFDYGQGISLAPGEQAQFVCAGDTAFGADETLPYGQAIKAGVLRCESAQPWISCSDVRTGHGFSISREAYRLF